VKLLFDENLPAALIVSLDDLYPGSEHVLTAGLGGSEDGAVWKYAGLHGLTIVSKDSDFFNRSVVVGAPPKVIWIRRGNCSTTEIEHLLRSNHAAITEFLTQDRETCLVLGRL
jgi:predicted nuclease of predicted toxin-antitoxin system